MPPRSPNQAIHALSHAELTIFGFQRLFIEEESCTWSFVLSRSTRGSRRTRRRRRGVTDARYSLQYPCTTFIHYAPAPPFTCNPTWEGRKMRCSRRNLLKRTERRVEVWRSRFWAGFWGSWTISRGVRVGVEWNFLYLHGSGLGSGVIGVVYGQTRKFLLLIFLCRRIFFVISFASIYCYNF